MPVAFAQNLARTAVSLARNVSDTAGSSKRIPYFYDCLLLAREREWHAIVALVFFKRN
jgi:hypothetical protein